MAITAAFLGIDEPAAVDKRVDGNSMTRGSAVIREMVSIGSADAATPEDIAACTAANGLEVDVTRSALPSGAATLSAQLADGHNVAIQTTAGTPGSVRLSDGGAFYKATTPADTQPISAVSLPLPAGAATTALQLAAGHTVDQTGAPWTFDGNKTSDGAVPGTDNLGVLPVVATAAAPSYTEGRMAALSTNLGGAMRALLVAGSAEIGSLAGSTNNIGDVDVLTMPTDASAAQVQGTVAHDSPDTENPVKVGAKAINLGTTPTSVANNDRTDLYANRAGVPFVLGGHPNTERLHQRNTAVQTDQVLKTVGANERFVVTSVLVNCSNANTADVDVILEFDDATDVVFWQFDGIPPGGGASEGDGSGILAIGGIAFDVLLTNSVPSGGSVNVHVTGFLINQA